METKVIIVDLDNLNKSENDIKIAAEIIRGGGLVAFPTETVYGLGGDGTNPDAARKIYSAKGRPSDNPLIIHISEPTEAEKYTYTNELYYKLADRFMPGPLTVVMRSKDSIPKETRGGLSTVAVRCPSHPVARMLIAMADRPIAAPSANLSGSPSPTEAGHVIDDMIGRIDMIIDSGSCEIGLESTIVKINDDESLTLLRPGGITLEMIKEFIPDARLDGGLIDENSVPKCPGLKYKHYSPKAKVIVVQGNKDKVREYISSKLNLSKNTGVLTYGLAEYKNAKYIINAGNNMDEYAHNLFSAHYIRAFWICILR